jgi:hypothetical protein
MNPSKENLDKIHFYLLKKFKSYCWISGGSIADVFEERKPRDVDVYFPSNKAKDEAVEVLMAERARVIQVYPMGTKLQYNDTEIDLTHVGRTPQEVFEKFDYTIVCAAIDKSGEFYSHPQFFEHLGEKKLHYTGNAPSKGAAHYTNKAKRYRKYLKKGFSMDEENLDKWLDSLVRDNKKPKKKPQNKS